MSFYNLRVEIGKSCTSGYGYPDKLDMKLVGLESSRCRLLTRDARELCRGRCRQMLLEAGVPGGLPA